MKPLTLKEKQDIFKLSVLIQTTVEKWEDKRPYIEVSGLCLCKDGSVSLYIRRSDRKIKRKRGFWLRIPRAAK